MLPLTEEKKTQKVAAGDMSGVVQCFSVKKGEFNVAFKTLPSAANKASGGHPGTGRLLRRRLHQGLRLVMEETAGSKGDACMAAAKGMPQCAHRAGHKAMHGHACALLHR